MLDVKKLVASVESCLGWPYVSPGTNDQNGIDCSGLFVKAFRDQGGSIYHGSNSIYRKYCSEKGKLTSVSQLRVGMAVFKWNAVWAVVFAIAAGLTAVFAGKITGKKEKSGETGERGTGDRDTGYRGGSHDTEEQGGDNT